MSAVLDNILVSFVPTINVASFTRLKFHKFTLFTGGKFHSSEDECFKNMFLFTFERKQKERK